MDVTPQVINEVEFHQKMRGYDPDEVDDFLERVAVAVGQLQDRLHEAAERVTSAERRAGELEARLKEVATRPGAAAPAAAVAVPPSVEEEAETIRRTLILAQRTADAAIKEAEESAQRTVQSAQDQASQLYREAEERAAALVADAEAEAKRSGEATRQALVAEIITLEETRDALRADSGILERHLDEQCLRLRSSVSELQRLLDDPSRLRVAPLPSLSEVSRPPAVAEALETTEPAPEADAAEEFEPAPGTASTDDEVIDLATPAPAGGVTFTPPDEADSGLAPTTPSEDEAWARFVGDGGPPTESYDFADDDDAYLSELRKAMVDDRSGVFAPDEETGDERQRLRFGRRR
jgi:DivIVA domain-containing protein